MKIFAIRDESDNEKRDLAYLLYYETEKRFYIELPDDADLWKTPLVLDSFVKRGEKTVNSYWSKVWVQQRIIPPDRQNLGQILRDNGLDEYDEFSLLMLSMGRCAQDEYYLVPLNEQDLPQSVCERFEKRIEDVVPLDCFSLLVFFRNGAVKKCDLKSYFQDHVSFHILLKREDYFKNMRIQTGGYGVTWDDTMNIADSELYLLGKEIPLCLSDFRNYVRYRVITVAEAAEILGCSRQNIDDLTKRGKLHPIKTFGKSTLYLKSEVLKRNWQ
ncbi:MAG: helix-turn-helix domain-containing protein [Clostridiales bacterium]|nr:helix-turn-helix domain-containing protein [Clostridiales bacterium]